MSDHSVLPDRITGWQQRELTAKLRQFPLIFVNPAVDKVSKTLTSFGNNEIYRVVYMGPRYSSNMKAYKHYCSTQSNSKIAEEFVYGVKQLTKFVFRHEHESQKFFPIRISEYRLFTGMNPTFKKDDLRFDSDFQCGNLDLAIYINPVEYDLVMRVDSNTKGHTAWFYFKVSNGTPNSKIKFNIINFNKKYLLYKDGMKPFVFKKSSGKWSQSCINVTYNGRKFRYEGLEQSYYQCLSFIYEFKDSEDVYFAYGVPYSYSLLLHRLEEMRTKSPHLIKINYDNESTGGLPIPVLTISNFSTAGDKINALCIGRLHPGETQGSWMIDGFIQQLLSPESHYIREKVIFKIVPMANVDGVVLGNFRTGIMGRDLNRCFHLSDRYNQISIIHRIAQQTNPLIFIDFHGHSGKKNVFIYGPDYRLEDKNYILCRLFPKLISKQTEAFRYYACSFAISRAKTTTGRAVMLKSFKTEFSYTVEASSFAYGPAKNETCFNSQQYESVGKRITSALQEFIRFIKLLPKKQQSKSKKEQNQKQEQVFQKNLLQEKQGPQVNENGKPFAGQGGVKSNLIDIDSNQYLSVIQKSLLREIMKQDPPSLQEGDKSQDSDFEDETNDYSNSEINNIMECKFESKQKHKPKKANPNNQKNKKKQRQKDKDMHSVQIEYKKSIQIFPSSKKRKKTLERKTLSIKNIEGEQERMVMNNSETIDVIPNIQKHYESFESKASKLLSKDSNFMDGIILNNIKKKKIDGSKQFLSSNSIDGHMNNLKYDWNKKKQQQIMSKNFSFEIPEFVEPVIANRKKQQIRESPKKQKKNPLISIKKSLLPILGRATQVVRQSQQKERSLLSSILQEHQRKKKVQKSFKIMFL